MSDKVKSITTTAYTMFIFDFADPTEVDKELLMDNIPINLNELFDAQKYADKAKRQLGKDFGKLLSIFFDQFQSRKGLDHIALKSSLEKNHKVMLRHLGKDKMIFLKLLCSLAEALEQKDVHVSGSSKKRGLLFEVA